MISDHMLLSSDVLSAPCSVCRVWPDSLHIVGVIVFCAGCCPEHKPDQAWLEGAAKAPVVGEQGGLF